LIKRYEQVLREEFQAIELLKEKRSGEVMQGLLSSEEETAGYEWVLGESGLIRDLMPMLPL